MRSRTFLFIALLTLLTLTLLPAGMTAQDQGLVAKWSFEEVATPTAHDTATGLDDAVDGFYKYVPGVSGTGLRFDGYTTQVTRAAEKAPKLNGTFSVEAWVALNTLPWNWVPIIDHELYRQVGYSFGIDAFGHVGLQLAVDGVWQSLVSTAELPLKRWAHVAGTFDPARGLAIYIDGKEVGRLPITGNMRVPEHADLLIGRIREAAIPFPAEAIHPIYPVWYSLDGILDEVRIYSRSLSPEDVQKNFAEVQAPTGEVLPWPVLPSGHAGARTLRSVLRHAQIRGCLGPTETNRAGVRRGGTFRPVPHSPGFLAGYELRPGMGH